MAFTHLHVHTMYSLLDGSNKITDYVRRLKELGMTAGAITDHGVMYGVIDFYKACKAEGINPIIGCEVYVAPGSRFDRDPSSGEDRYYHLILLAENNQGYQNLMHIVSRSFTEGYYYKPRVDLDLLKEFHEGIIASSACLAGEVARNIVRDDIPAAEKAALRYQDIFGKGNFFLELQDHGYPDQQKVNAALLSMSKKLDIPLIATNDVHYTFKEDAEAHDILLCIQTGKKLSDENRMRYPGGQFYLKSEEEMRRLFPYAQEALDNTQKIADRCHVEIEFGVTKLPHFDVPEGYDSWTYLRKLCDDGMRERYPDDDGTVRNRLEYELSTIRKMGYVDYFLIVWDYINFSREHDIMIGPGRGSAAGSIVSYCLHITNIDPIRYNLLFERFLNPERVSMPDIDVDFGFERRGEVIDYVTKKYGKDKVMQIITFGTMAAKGVVRDVGRVMDLPYSFCDNIAKMIPNELGITLDKALKMNPELRRAYEDDEKVHKLIDMSRRLEGLPRHTSVHAAGVVICSEPAENLVPLSRAQDGSITTQFTMTTIEELGLLKMDFLGLRTLTVIQNAIKMANLSIEQACRRAGKPLPHVKLNIAAEKILDQDHSTADDSEHIVFEGTEPGMVPSSEFDTVSGIYPKEPKIGQKPVSENPVGWPVMEANINYDDPDVYASIGTGKTDGIFQLESGGMQSFMKELAPENLEDVIAGISLYRPGPMDFIPKYIAGKKDKSSITYAAPQLEHILAPTYGCIVYQEQVMQIVRDLGGYTLGRSDIVRRAMSKKKQKVMEQERRNFIYGNPDEHVPGCIANGIPEKTASDIYDTMMDFARYAFNKSHAACYAVVAYQTAWLKYYYPTEFMAALMTSVIDFPVKVSNYIQTCRAMGIRILPPDINEGEAGFSVSDGCIRYALTAIKGVGRPIIDGIIKERKLRGPYRDLNDFLGRMVGSGCEINRRAVENFIKAGALDCFGATRKQLMSVYARVLDDLQSSKKDDMAGQMSLFDFADEEDKKNYRIQMPDIGEYSKDLKLAFEKEVLGFYVSGHPLEEYEGLWKSHVTSRASDFLLDDETGKTRLTDGVRTTVGGMVDEKKIKYTKNNKVMAFITLEDLTGSMEVIVFPKSYEEYSHLLDEENKVFIRGRVSLEEDRDGKLICESVTPFDAVPRRVWIRFRDPENWRAHGQELMRIVEDNGGRDQVVIYIEHPRMKKVLPPGQGVKASPDLMNLLYGTFGRKNVEIT